MPGFNIGATGSGSEDFGGGPSGTIEVARSHRWLITIPGANFINDLRFYAHSCDRPNTEFDRVTIHHGINEIYLPGKVRWNPIEIKFYEVFDVNDTKDAMADAMYEWWKTVIDPDAQKLKSKNTRDLKKDVHIKMLSGLGDTVWEYALYGVWPIKMTASQLSYKTSDLAELSVTLHYDWASQKNKET